MARAIACCVNARPTPRASRCLAGPEEATVVGNLLGQAIALGDIASLAEARAVVRESFEPTLYEPTRHAEWTQAYARFEEILGVPERGAGHEALAR